MLGVEVGVAVTEGASLGQGFCTRRSLLGWYWGGESYSRNSDDGPTFSEGDQVLFEENDEMGVGEWQHGEELLLTQFGLGFPAQFAEFTDGDLLVLGEVDDDHITGHESHARVGTSSG